MRIVILAGKGENTNIVYNKINSKFEVLSVIIEDKESIKLFLKRRLRKLGFFVVISQILFELFIAKPLNILSKRRKQEIIKKYSLNKAQIPKRKVYRVTSINSDSTVSFLKSLDPDVVIVNGTRIISNKVLSAVNCRFINTHAGITPKYRGVHGGYWALVSNDLRNCGVTIHFVDSGIDTGSIIRQELIRPGKEDNFSTYPLLQLSEGLKLLIDVLQDLKDNSLNVNIEIYKESKLWFHPTIWDYLYFRVVRGVK
jgi:folate-dependent phosphoribosylglycinamide formyltransferase PurN